MKFQQRSTVRGDPEQVWAALADVQQTALCIPGVESVRADGENTLTGVMKVRVGPVSIALDGKVVVRERNDGERRLVMSLEASDRRVGATVQGTITVSLAADQSGQPGQTALLVDADVNLLGKLAGLGQPIIRLKAEQTLREFAKNLTKRVGDGGPGGGKRP
jgi:carbon monoxide dehydrogenase subunit G